MMRLLRTEQGPHHVLAVVKNGRLLDIYAERTDRPSRWGAVYRGKISRRLADGRSAFVDLGEGLTGYLQSPKPLPTRDDVLVQVQQDGQAGKRPALGFGISLPGPLLVYLPFGQGFSFSRRLDGDARTRLQQELAKITADFSGGWIVRAQAAEADEEFLRAEAGRLAGKWPSLGSLSSAPACLLAPPGILGLAQCDHGVQALDTVADESILDEWISRSLARTVSTSSDIKIHIDETPTLTAIDIDFGARRDFASAGREALSALVPEIRWRQLGGMIVVDVPRLSSRSAREAFLRELETLTQEDPVDIQIYGFTRLGLLEMTRRRRGFSLAQALEGSEWAP